MIATPPVFDLAPHDYRYALDAVMPLLAAARAPTVLCNVPALGGEVSLRFPGHATLAEAPAALWVEPLANSWLAELRIVAAALPDGAPLAIIASRPLARQLPERRLWTGCPLGMRLCGIGQLRRHVVRAGFALTACYGIHSALSVALNVLGQQFDRAGYPDIGDRLHFAARLRYCAVGPLAPLSTVALLIATKVTR